MLNDNEIEKRVGNLRRTVSRWLKKHRIDHDVAFKTYAEHFDDDPGTIPLIMCITSAVDSAINFDLQTEFVEMLESLGFWYEFETASAVSFFPSNNADVEHFRDYLAFRYYTDLLAPDFTDIYTEIFQYFAKRPQQLEKLTWRGFEELVASVFKNQGYRTELGRGWADEGVDIRLLEHSVHGELSTLVQVKKYRKDRPIGLEAIAALSGHLYDRGASKGIFVTTSRYLPGAQRFAARQEKTLVLADSGDLSDWCLQISKRLGGQPIEHEYQRIVDALNRGEKFLFPVGEIVRASVGVGCIMNKFALVIRATPRAALLVELPVIQCPYTSYPFVGKETPDLATTPSKFKVIKAKRQDRDGETSFWGDKNLFFIWDHKPVHYDWND